VAAGVFRETVRERVLYNLLIFAVLMIAAGLLLRDLSIRQDVRIIKDLGLASIQLFGWAIAVFVGVGLVSKEIERRSLYPLLASPLGRGEFLVGKFLGLAFTLAVNVGVMTVALYLTLLSTGGQAGSLAERLDPVLLQAVLGIYMGLLLIVSVAMFFSVTESAALTAILTLTVLVIGQFADVIRNMRDVVPGAPGWLTYAAYLILPNFQTLDLKTRAVHGQALPAGDLLLVVAYAGVYCAILLILADVRLRRRDL